MITSRKITERRNQIVELIKNNEVLRISDAMELFHVSDETIRKDFAYLEKRGILKKVHGGALAIENDNIAPISKRQAENYSLKMAISKKALEFLPSEQSIIGIDIGSTMSILAGLISKLTDNIIITNSFPALHELTQSSNTLISTGGEYHPHDMCFRGELTKNALQTFALDICFLGSSGVLNRNGICTTSFFDIDIKREFIKRSKISVVLLDSSKFHKSSLVQVADWSEVDMVISDTGIPDKERVEISKKTQLIII